MFSDKWPAQGRPARQRGGGGPQNPDCCCTTDLVGGIVVCSFWGVDSVSPWPQMEDWKLVEGLVLDFDPFLQESC